MVSGVVFCVGFAVELMILLGVVCMGVVCMLGIEFDEVVLVNGTVGTEVSLEPMSKTNVIPTISARQAAIEKTIRRLFFLGASLAAAASAMMLSSTSESARMNCSSFFINSPWLSLAKAYLSWGIGLFLPSKIIVARQRKTQNPREKSFSRKLLSLPRSKCDSFFEEMVFQLKADSEKCGFDLALAGLFGFGDLFDRIEKEVTAHKQDALFFGQLF